MRYLNFLFITLFLIVYSCANPGYPTGGPKDEAAPKIKKSRPEPNALNYKEKEIVIEFDEIIKLNDVYQKYIVSPPLKNRPIITARSNKLNITFEEELQENSTYTIDLADAVEDNNEGNAIPSFVFSYSTGEVIDSFAIMGNLWDAEDLSPMEGMLVMVHKNMADTAFTHEVPLRLGKTDKNGFFAIRNLSLGEYRVYALEDGNRNYMFDQPGESIAWLDSTVSPSMEYVEIPDTIAQDSVVHNSIVQDSIVLKKELVYSPNDLQLFMFKEKTLQQYFIGEERKDSNRISFVFNLPVENFTISPLDIEQNKDWAIFEPSVNNDTISIWIVDKDLYERDTITMAMSYLGLDTLNNPIQKMDTLKMYYFEIGKKETRRKRKKGDKKVKTLAMSSSSSNVDVNKSFAFLMPTPIKNINKEALHLYERVDTLIEERKFSFSQDSLFERRYTVNVDTKWTQGGNYVFAVDSAGIEDVYGLKCDSIGKEFSVKSIDSYGLILIDIMDSEENWLVQLMSSGKVVRQKYVPKSGKLFFQYIDPGTYDLKLVVDKNMNEEWDTGKYATKTQPERVFYYPSGVRVRANWDTKESWDLKEFDIYDFVSKNRKPKQKEK